MKDVASWYEYAPPALCANDTFQLSDYGRNENDRVGREGNKWVLLQLGRDTPNVVLVSVLGWLEGN
jgi:hypothetical protein